MDTYDEMVLCAASNYTRKYYLNDYFDGLPKGIKEELQITCVMFTEEIGGTIQFVFDEEGNLEIRVGSEEDDILYDEIGSGLKVRQIQREKRDLFEGLEMYYRIFFLGEEE